MVIKNEELLKQMNDLILNTNKEEKKELILYIYTTDLKTIEYGLKLPENTIKYISYKAQIIGNDLLISEYFDYDEGED